MAPTRDFTPAIEETLTIDPFVFFSSGMHNWMRKITDLAFILITLSNWLIEVVSKCHQWKDPALLIKIPILPNILIVSDKIFALLRI